MQIKTLFLLFSMMVLGACGNAQAPAATASREPDRIGTRVAEELAVASTLTAAAPTPNPTAPSASTGTPAPSPESTVTFTPKPALATPTPKPQPTTAPSSPEPEAEVYAIIVPGGQPNNGLEGNLVAPGQRGRIEDSPVTYRNRINVRMRVWDPAAGGNDGDGIESVEFMITSDTGDVVYQRRETKRAYCLFGSNSANCASFDIARGNYTWPKSEAPQQRMTNGSYHLQAFVNKKSGGQGSWGFDFELKGIPSADADPATAQVIIAIVDPPVNSIVTDRLVFQATTRFTGSGEADGDGIDKVKLEIIDASGAVVYERTENTKPYCAFQDTNNRCNAWVFAEHGNTWKNNAPIVSGAYTLRATSFAKTGASAFTNIGIQIQLP